MTALFPMSKKDCDRVGGLFLMQTPEQSALQVQIESDKRICYGHRRLTVVHVEHVAIAVLELTFDRVILGQEDTTLKVTLLVESYRVRVRPQHMQVDRLAVRLVF